MFNSGGTYDKGYNVAHQYVPWLDRIDQKGYELYATTSIGAGEELLTPYNRYGGRFCFQSFISPSNTLTSIPRCDICQAMFDWFGAPEMFLNFGIVSDDMPQMFLFDFARVKFELDHGADGEVEVQFLVPPSERGIGLLEGQLRRLTDFAAEKRGRDDRGGISEYEWDMIWRYHATLQGAISLAVDASGGEELTDEVWSMDDDWWVQLGNIKMADDYAWINPTLPQHLIASDDYSKYDFDDSSDDKDDSADDSDDDGSEDDGETSEFVYSEL